MKTFLKRQLRNQTIKFWKDYTQLKDMKESRCTSSQISELLWLKRASSFRTYESHLLYVYMGMAADDG